MSTLKTSVPTSTTFTIESADDNLSIQLSTTGQELNVASTRENGWRVTASGGPIGGTVSAGARAMLCRVTPRSRPEITQATFGDAAGNNSANALFDPDTDMAVEFAGATLLPGTGGWTLQPLENAVSITVHPHYLRDTQKVRYYKPLDKTFHRVPPSGWCSWYIYYTGITEENILANARWMAEHLKPFGAEILQLDDGWQGFGSDAPGARDWFTLDPDFPHGMRWMADQIVALGLKPGLWSTPFGQSADALFKTDPEMWIRREDGTSIGILETREEWVGRYYLDASNPKSREYLYQMFRMFSDWGYVYFKIDGQADMPVAYTVHHERLYDPSLADADVAYLGDRQARIDAGANLYINQHLDDGEIYRAGLEAIRRAIGDHRFLLGCGGTPLLNGAGYWDGARTGSDVEANWRGFKPYLRAVREGYFLHNIAWYSDPDVLCVRDPLTLEEARLWASAFGLSGQLLMASDDMPALPEERVELLRRVYPAADVYPVDLFPYEKDSTVWNTKINTSAGQWDVVGLFNYSDQATTLSVTTEELGLLNDNYLAFDFWNKKVLGSLDNNTLSAELPPHTCRIYAIKRAADHPQVISTSRHILQGALDLHRVHWDAETRSLSGESDLVGGDPYELRIALPEGSEWAIAEVVAEGAEVETTMGADLVRVTLTRPENRQTKWSVRF